MVRALPRLGSDYRRAGRALWRRAPRRQGERRRGAHDARGACDSRRSNFNPLPKRRRAGAVRRRRRRGGDRRDDRQAYRSGRGCRKGESIMTDHIETSVDNNLSGWLQPDVTAAFETRSGTLAKGPERRLMVAVLEDGIHRYQKSAAARTLIEKEIFAEEEEWLFGPGEDGPFAFETICDALGLDADYLRGGLRGWRERNFGRRRPQQKTRTCVSGSRWCLCSSA